MKRLGVVVGNPKVDKFNFGASVEDKIRRGQLIEVPNAIGKIIAQIDEITAANEYFGDGSVRQHIYRNNISTFMDKTVFLATATPLAMLNGTGSINSPDLPVVPGSEVLPVSRETAKEVLGFKENGINLGVMMHNEDVQVSLDQDKLIPTHVAILAQTGGGKTYTVLVMLEEFLKKNLTLRDEVLGKNAEMHTLIIDPHGEYKNLLNSAKKLRKENAIHIFNGPFTIPVNETPPTFFQEIVELTDAQFRILEDSWNKINGSNQITINNLENSIRRSAGAKQTKDILLQILEKFKSHKLIADEGSIDLNKKISENKILILDFSRISSYIQQVYLKYALKKIFDDRIDGNIPPLCTVIEEIHNFAPSSELSITRGVIRRIAREGRKFGVGLCIASQRPSMIDTTVISQCSTIIALSVYRKIK